MTTRTRRKISKTRQLLQNDISAFDKNWKGIMDDMPIEQLLSKVHPNYRDDHARALKATGEISERTMKEFTTNKNYYYGKDS